MPRADGSLTPRWLGTIPSLGSLLGITEQEEVGASFLFHAGDFVDYYSNSTASWIPAKVLAQRADGLYDLDCKTGVEPTKVRAATFSKPEYEVGSIVEFYSSTAGMWLPATIKMYNGIAGTYDLDCKSGVQPDRIRLPAANTRAPSRDEDLKEESAEDAVGIEVSGGSSSSLCRALEPQQDGPVQLIRVVRRGPSWHFELCQDAIKVLESLGQKCISVCAVCGPYRTGKSYLLNLLLGRIQKGYQQFRVGSTTQACTDGLWMWGFGAPQGVDSPSLLFLDCEGFGSTESDKTRDAKLMSLCMLLSSVFLLNTKGVLSEGLFNALSLVCNLATHVEQEQDTSKPALLWLLRDFLLELVDEEGRRMTPDEYLESSLHKAPPEGADSKRSQAAREVRETLLRFFPQRRCATLCQPVIEEEQLRQLSEVPFEQLRPEFRRSFQELQTQLLRLAAQPKTIQGKPVSAGSWAAMLRKLVSALNEGHALNVVSAWNQVQHSACDDLATELHDRASEAFQKVREGGPLPVARGRSLPVADQTLAASLKEFRRCLHEEWRRRAVGDEAVKAEHWKDLKAAIKEEEKGVERLNAELAEAHLNQAGADWSAWLSQDRAADPTDPKSEALINAVDADLPAKPILRAVREALSTSRMARLKWDGNSDALKAKLKLATDELDSKAALAAEASGEQLEKSREMGHLHGQVELLQQQANEAIERERQLREQVLLAEEATRKAQYAHNEAKRQSNQSIEELQTQVAQLRSEVLELQEKPGHVVRRDHPKCACSIM